MGVNLSIEKLDGTEYKGWDESRYVGDENIADFLEYTWPRTRADEDTYWNYLRPQNLENISMSGVIARQFPYPERFIELVTILRDNPEYWLYISR